MSESLREQLLKSGLAKTHQPAPARDATNLRQRTPPDTQRGDRPRRPPQQQTQHVNRGKEDIDLAKAYALRDRNERDLREREQKAAEQRSREKKERRQKIAALVNAASLNHAEAEIPRHFPHSNKIRRVYVTETQLPQLNGGELAIVQHAGRYLLVTRDKAIAVRDIDADAVVLLCDPQGNDDDGVPADLVW